MLRSCYKKHIKQVENNIAVSSKSFWSFVKSKKKVSDIPDTMYLDNVSSTDGKQISDLFNKHFNSVFEQDVSESEAEELCKNYVDNNLFDVGSISISADMINKYLKNIDINKGAGPDNIPPIFLRRCHDTLSFPLCILFRLSLSQGVVPPVWKRSFIVPVYKGGDKHDVKNHRPIAKLSVIPKLFEKIVYDCIMPTIRPMIISQQHGFVNKKSTETNLCELTHYVTTSMDSGYQVDVVYTDYAKAFDKISHNILIRKLEHIGVHGDLLRWLTSYLRDRSQAVTVKGFCSTFTPVSSGVPQGSHLGPLLFIIFINDIKHAIRKSNFLLYADDNKIYKTIKKTEDSIDLQSDLNELCNYCVKNRLHLNVKKCYVVSFTRKRNIITHTYSLFQESLSRETLVRDLGVYIDSKLLFDSHIKIISITDKAYRMLGFVLRMSREFKRTSTLILLYNALVRSILEYASTVWSPQYNVYKNMIERIQSKFIKHLSWRKYKNTEDVVDLPQLEKRRTERDQVFLYKLLHNALDTPYLLEKVSIRCPRISNRHRTLFYVPHRSTNYAANTFLLRSCRQYNSNFVDVDLFHLSFCQFKKCVKTALID